MYMLFWLWFITKVICILLIPLLLLFFHVFFLYLSGVLDDMDDIFHVKAYIYFRKTLTC